MVKGSLIGRPDRELEPSPPGLTSNASGERRMATNHTTTSASERQARLHSAHSLLGNIEIELIYLQQIAAIMSHLESTPHVLEPSILGYLSNSVARKADNIETHWLAALGLIRTELGLPNNG